MSEVSSDACRLRVRYIKDGRLAHLGHLEVMGTVMRSVRRAGLPFEVSNGFARRMRIQFCQALPVGASSVAEYFDLMMPSRVSVADALEALRAASPAKLAPVAAELLPRRMPALEAWANRASWDVTIPGQESDVASFEEGLALLRERGILEFMRGEKRRRLDLTTTLVSWSVTPQEDGLGMILETRSTERGSLRPAILVKAVIGTDPIRVCRTGQWHETEDGALVEPLGKCQVTVDGGNFGR